MHSIFKKLYLFKIINYLYSSSKYSYLIKYAASIGIGLKVYGDITFYNEELLSIGDNVHLNQDVILNARGWISLWDNVVLSAWAQLHSTWLDSATLHERKHINDAITIEEGVWVCANSVIVWPASIGKWSIIAAHSFVKWVVPAFELRWGIPAKKIKNLR